MQRKFLTHAIAAGLLFGLGAAGASAAQSAGESAPSIGHLPAYPVPPQQRARAQAVAQQGVPVTELAAGAPARYTVKRGDTLWHIAGLYLKRPWNWPDLWGMNMARIRNPHWIFPGQTLVLKIVNGRAILSLEGTGEIPTVKVEPGVQYEALPPSGIPTLDPQIIGPFLTKPLVVEPEELERSPRIVSATAGHVMLSPGDLAYVRGPVGEGKHFDVYRPAKALRDPKTHKVIAYESDYVGSVQLLHGPQDPDAVSTARVLSTVQEMGPGDRLIATPPRQYLNFEPKAPADAVHGEIVSIYGDRQMAGRGSVVALDRGQNDGLRRGDVLAIMQAPREVVDTTVEDKPTIEIPSRRKGLLMVFRTFHHVSFALVLDADGEIQVPDTVTSP